jgi:hypothetical protein
MFFGNGLHEAWLHILDSHPPLEQRILCVDPSFDGVYPKVEPLPPLLPETPPPVAAPGRQAHAAVPVLTGLAVAALLEKVEEPMQRHIDLARQLIAALPASVSTASRDPLGATAIVYGLLLERDPATRERQEQLVATHDGPEAAGELRRLLPFMEHLEARARLPLLDLCFPALRSLDPQRFRHLKQTTEALITADGRVNLFEFALRYILIRRLEIRFSNRPPRPVQIYGIRGVQAECSCVLTTMARVGQPDENRAREAFDRGGKVLQEPKAEFSFLPASECGGGALERALAALEGVSPLIKRKLLAACMECLLQDGVVTVGEAELFRAIADALGCPVPPEIDPGMVREK